MPHSLNMTYSIGYRKSSMLSKDSLDYGPIKSESEEKKAKADDAALADLSLGPENAH